MATRYIKYKVSEYLAQKFGPETRLSPTRFAATVRLPADFKWQGIKLGDMRYSRPYAQLKSELLDTEIDTDTLDALDMGHFEVFLGSGHAMHLEVTLQGDETEDGEVHPLLVTLIFEPVTAPRRA